MRNHIVVLLALLFAFPGFAKELVFIHSYHFEYPWVKEYREGFESEIGAMTIHDFQMDTKRKPAEQFPAIADKAWEFIQQHDPDVVVVSDDNALKYLGPRLIDNKIPTFFLGINANPRNYISITPTISGVLERPLMKRSVYMISKVLPEVKNIRVLMDDAATSHAILETSFSNKLNQDINGITVHTSLVPNYESWESNVLESKNQGYEAIIIANYAALKDESGKHYSLDEVSAWTSENSPLPIFAFWSYSVGPGKAIGGLSISALEQGIEVAKLINQFNEKGNMPTITTPKKGAFIFSQTELERWQLQVPSDIEKNAEMRK
ncbi:ABC transporter substrate-binding protein [Vibrio nigripulchritudo]|uniref:ABC transporter substrate-binding protein n=1 Tax=Vibrio nigripulchritudo TaxID=28173 RepID=UPI0003B1F341|nr:ABC transporter substrate-binding protein [Vibrio nigripulchritudo]CCN70167.1 putative ABC transporter substrate binding protein [Vibrio nigripulchritudo SFn118]